MAFLKIVLLLTLSTRLSWGYEDYEYRDVRNYLSTNRDQSQGPQGRCDTRSCACSQEYIPFCGTNGVTYGNKCQLQCAQNCDRSLKVNFEGVCSKPYIHEKGRQGQNGYGSLPRPVQVSTGSITVVGNSPNAGYGSNRFRDTTIRPSYQLPIYTFPPTRRYEERYPTSTPRYYDPNTGRYQTPIYTFPTSTPRPYEPNTGRYQTPIYTFPTTTSRYELNTGRYQTHIYTFPTTRRYGDDFGGYPINTTPNPYLTRTPPTIPFPTTKRPGRYQQWLATSTERPWFVPPQRQPSSPIDTWR